MKEIEIKSLLPEDKYLELKHLLPQLFRQVNSDTITTMRFRPGDVRVRWSDKMAEIVVKEGDPTVVAREETTIGLKDSAEAERMVEIFRKIGLKDDPRWVKEKSEYIVSHKGHDYTLSLQHIKDFAFILEAEIISDEGFAHEGNLKELLNGLGCEPIDNEDFKNRIQEYIVRNAR